ncbi:MAG: 30S ribosomal protein S6, partial [Ignavibacteriales bacterium]|nr:30S ribosomal protein S6 [Ignavibacteriales bacterium]
MKNSYETAAIIDATLEDEQIAPIVEKYRSFINSNDGNVFDEEDWGKRRLAYQIKKHRLGYYIIFRFEAPPELVKELTRLYRLDDYVVRFLTIKLDKRMLEHFDDQKKKAAKEAAEREAEEKANAEAAAKKAEEKAEEKSDEEKPAKSEATAEKESAEKESAEENPA